MGKMGVVVVAAGKGSRMGTVESKQYLTIQQKPILVHTLETFDRVQEVDSIVVVVGSGDIARCEQYAEQYGLRKIHSIIAGGAERQESVCKGLEALPAESEWVLVHDGVRPLITREKIVQCWHEAMKSGAAVLAVPVKDTIKTVNSSGHIDFTPDRRSLWAIQTPQAFRLSLLKQAHEQALKDQYLGTDDSLLVERLGIPVRVIEGDYNNIKITTPEDLLWVDFLLKARLSEGGETY